MLDVFGALIAELLTPVLSRVRRHERTIWIVLIAVLLALFIAAVVRLGLGGD